MTAGLSPVQQNNGRILPQEPLTRDLPKEGLGSAGRRRLHELRRTLLHQGGRECIGNHINMVLYHRPLLFLAGVILFRRTPGVVENFSV